MQRWAFTSCWVFPFWVAGLLTAIITFLILGLERYGFRPLEAVITGSDRCDLALLPDRNHPGQTRLGRGVYTMRLCPNSLAPESVLLATGILGATVMPHVIFLHSSLTQKRIVVAHPCQAAQAIPL